MDIRKHIQDYIKKEGVTLRDFCQNVPDYSPEYVYSSYCHNEFKRGLDVYIMLMLPSLKPRLNKKFAVARDQVKKVATRRKISDLQKNIETANERLEQLRAANPWVTGGKNETR